MIMDGESGDAKWNASCDWHVQRRTGAGIEEGSVGFAMTYDGVVQDIVCCLFMKGDTSVEQITADDRR
jgi:hypothetical protein